MKERESFKDNALPLFPSLINLYPDPLIRQNKEEIDRYLMDLFSDDIK